MGKHFEPETNSHVALVCAAAVAISSHLSPATSTDDKQGFTQTPPPQIMRVWWPNLINYHRGLIEGVFCHVSAMMCGVINGSESLESVNILNMWPYCEAQPLQQLVEQRTWLTWAVLLGRTENPVEMRTKCFRSTGIEYLISSSSFQCHVSNAKLTNTAESWSEIDNTGLHSFT